MIWDYIEGAKTLNSFSGLVFNDKIRQYISAEDELLTLTKEEMYYRLTHNLPSPYENGDIARELTLLKKAISSNGRGLSIRTLFEQLFVPLKTTLIRRWLKASPIIMPWDIVPAYWSGSSGRCSLTM